MKTYTVTVEFEKPNRDSWGTPQWGLTTVDIVATDENNMNRSLDQQFGKNHYNILDFTESSTPSP